MLCSSNLLVTFFSAASTTPSAARTPSAVPACEIASIAYSTWYSRPGTNGSTDTQTRESLRFIPSGEKIVVRES